jgi:hypothetical protein
MSIINRVMWRAIFIAGLGLALGGVLWFLVLEGNAQPHSRDPRALEILRKSNEAVQTLASYKIFEEDLAEDLATGEVRLQITSEHWLDATANRSYSIFRYRSQIDQVRELAFDRGADITWKREDGRWESQQTSGEISQLEATLRQEGHLPLWQDKAVSAKLVGEVPHDGYRAYHIRVIYKSVHPDVTDILIDTFVDTVTFLPVSKVETHLNKTLPKTKETSRLTYSEFNEPVEFPADLPW